MPLTPMFHVHAWGIPYVATMLGVKQVYPGRYVPEVLLKLLASEGVTFSHCVPSILNMLVSDPAAAARRPLRLEGADRRRGPAQARRRQGARPRHRRLGRLRPLRIRSGARHRQPERRAARAAPRGAGGAARPHGHADRAGRPEGGRRTRHGSAARRQDGRRDRRPGAVADPGLLQGPRQLGTPLGGRLAAHAGHRQPQRRRLAAHHRPRQGHRQDRRRVALVARARRHPLLAPGGRRRRGHRPARRQVGRGAPRRWSW